MTLTTGTDTPYWLVLLNAKGVARLTAKRIIQRWCLAENQPLSSLWELPASEIATGLEVNAAEAQSIVAAEQAVPEQSAVLDRLATRGIGCITRADAPYPDALVERLPENALPYYLYYAGNIALLTQPGIGVLGSQHPSPDELTMARDLAGRLANDGHHILGGYAEGIDRQAIDTARDAGGPVTLVIPMGIARFTAMVHRFDRNLEEGHCLILSPYAPDARSHEAAERGRLGLLAALVEALVLVAPDVAPERVLLPDQALTPEQRVLLWSSSAGPAADAWRAQETTHFADSDSARVAITDMFGVAPATLEQDEGTIDDLVGVEPISFEDADHAIRTLGHTGRVPNSLAQRLRERDWTQSDAGYWMIDDEFAE